MANWQLAVVATGAFFAIAELLLRVVGFDYAPYRDEFEITPDYEIFEPRDDGWVTRPSKLASFREQRFPARGKPGELRVFLLGGSSVHNLGDAPELRAALEPRLSPGSSLTLVNAGGRGYGTTRLRLHFLEIARHAPHLVILYTGHNEFNEKYLRDRFYEEGWLVDWNDALTRHSRVHQALSLGIHRATQANLPRFAPEFEIQWDEVYDKDERHRAYQENLRAMTEMAEERELPLLLSTVAYNRRTAPFKPGAVDYFACEPLRHQEQFERFRRCLDDAIDAGLHPIRATKTTNAIVARVAVERGLPLVDIDAVIVAAARNGIPSFELFEDHCHLNARGDRLLQDAWAEAIERYGLLPLAGGG